MARFLCIFIHMTGASDTVLKNKTCFKNTFLKLLTTICLFHTMIPLAIGDADSDAFSLKTHLLLLKGSWCLLCFRMGNSTSAATAAAVDVSGVKNCDAYSDAFSLSQYLLVLLIHILLSPFSFAQRYLHQKLHTVTQ